MEAIGEMKYALNQIIHSDCTEDIILYEKYLMEVIGLIISYESLQPMVYQQTAMGLVKIPAKIPIELLELRNNIESKIIDLKIRTEIYYYKHAVIYD